MAIKLGKSHFSLFYLLNTSVHDDDDDNDDAPPLEATCVFNFEKC